MMGPNGFEQGKPAEDAGAETQARFHFQHELIARRCFAMVRTGSDIARIICEWVTDYIVVYSGGEIELVSVKHLEPGQATWTLRGLCSDGGLAVLFRRWESTVSTTSCCLETNAGLRTGGPTDLQTACERQDEGALREFAEQIAPYLGNADPARVEDFLHRLRIHAALPARHDMKAHNLHVHVGPARAELGLPLAAEDLYERVLAIVEACNRDGDPRLSAGELLSLTPSNRDEAELRLQVGRRTIDAKLILRKLREAAIDPEPRLGLELDQDKESESPMVLKLRRGGLGETAVNNAKSLRMSWLTLRNRWSNGLPEDEAEAEFDDLKARVLHIAQAAETQVRVPGTVYGAEMQQELESQLKQEALGRAPIVPVSDLHLLGVAYDLTALCRIWWSDPFDLRKE